MADSDKDILITPNTGAASDPSVVFSSGATGGDDITLNVTDDGTITTLSYEGSAGQLFSITNSFSGVIFAVNDGSGIPSIEVVDDGTIRLAEFDGDVGIGTSGTPSHKLHITGPTTANTNTGIFIDSTGDAYLDLRADNTVGGLETNNPYVRFRQDQDAIEAVVGFNDNANDALGNAVTGAGPNEFVIHNRVASGNISLAVNGSVGLTVDDSNFVYIGQDTTGHFEAVDGEYGSVQVDGAEGSLGTWSGYSIGGRLVMMDLGGNATTNRGGLYDDLNNEWLLQHNRLVDGNNAVDLYYGGAIKLSTVTGGISVTGDMSSTTMQGLGYHASSGDAAPGADVWLRSNTSGYTYLGWINTTSGATTNVPDRIYTNQGGGDGFIRYQTVANFNTNVTSSASVGGDCTGTVGNIAVTNDSHTHAFNNLTSKGSGTGNYFTTGQMQAAAGFVGNYDDTASATWSGPIWGMDDGFTGSTGGANSAATSCYGIRWNRASSTAANSLIGEGFYVYQNGSLDGGIGASGAYMVNNLTVGGVFYPNGQTVGHITGVTGNYGSVQCNGADGSSGSYTGWSVEGELVLMLSGTTGGIYDDLNNNWKLRTDTTANGVAGKVSSCQAYDHQNTARNVGFNHVKEIAMTTANITLSDEHCGCIIRRTGTSAVTLTVPAGSDFPNGSMVTVLNHGTGGSLTISDGSEALYIMDGSGTVTDSLGFALAIGGAITIWRQGTSAYYVWGAGIP